MTRGRLRIAIVGGVLALALLVGWCSRAPAPTIATGEATRGPLRATVATNGLIEPVEDTDVRARLDGRVVFIPDPGTKVEAGAEILRIDGVPVAAELARARSDRLAAVESLRAARHDRDVVRDRFEVDRGLYRDKALARDRYLESEAAYRSASERVTALESEVPFRVDALDLRVKELEEQEAAAVVRAPVSGTVYRTEVKKGAVVRAGDPILRIADLNQLRVRTNIDQVDLGRVRAGQRVEVAANAFPNEGWKGEITEVVPHVVVKESRSVSEALAALTPPTNGLVPGMTVDVDIVVAEANDVLQVPSGSILVRDGAAFVFRVKRSRLRLTPVTLGLESVGASEVKTGLEAGDVVAVGVTRDLVDGMRIRARREGA